MRRGGLRPAEGCGSESASCAALGRAAASGVTLTPDVKSGRFSKRHADGHTVSNQTKGARREMAETREGREHRQLELSRSSQLGVSEAA